MSVPPVPAVLPPPEALVVPAAPVATLAPPAAACGSGFESENPHATNPSEPVTRPNRISISRTAMIFRVPCPVAGGEITKNRGTRDALATATFSGPSAAQMKGQGSENRERSRRRKVPGNRGRARHLCGGPVRLEDRFVVRVPARQEVVTVDVERDPREPNADVAVQNEHGLHDYVVRQVSTRDV